MNYNIYELPEVRLESEFVAVRRQSRNVATIRSKVCIEFSESDRFRISSVKTPNISSRTVTILKYRRTLTVLYVSVGVGVNRWALLSE